MSPVSTWSRKSALPSYAPAGSCCGSRIVMTGRTSKRFAQRGPRKRSTSSDGLASPVGSRPKRAGHAERPGFVHDDRDPLPIGPARQEVLDRGRLSGAQETGQNVKGDFHGDHPTADIFDTNRPSLAYDSRDVH